MLFTGVLLTDPEMKRCFHCQVTEEPAVTAEVGEDAGEVAISDMRLASETGAALMVR